MQAIALRLLGILPPLSRHLSAYAELGAAAAAEYRASFSRKLCWAALATVAGLAGLVAAWMIGLVAFWETPWRLTYVITSAAVLLAVAVIAAAVAFSPEQGGRAASLMREEIHKDMELVAQWTRTQ